MKKRVLALLCGGVMAVSALVLQMPVEVQAAEFGSCKGNSVSHVKSKKVENVDGKLSVTIDIVFELEDGEFGLYVFTKQLVKENDVTFIDMEDASRVAKKDGLKEGGTYTFDGLASGKTYYVYCAVVDNHNDEAPIAEDATLLGSVELSSASSSDSSSSSSSSSGGGESAWSSYEDKVTSQITAAQSGSTVVMEKGISALSNSIMKELLAKGDVSLKLEFTYKDQEYVIIIPAGAALDNDIPWYGPLYLAQQFGNRAGMEDAATSVTEETSVENMESTKSTVYEVRSGDTMSKIAAANHMTLTELLAKNPQIKNPGKIRVGQQINL